MVHVWFFAYRNTRRLQSLPRKRDRDSSRDLSLPVGNRQLVTTNSLNRAPLGAIVSRRRITLRVESCAEEEEEEVEGGGDTHVYFSRWSIRRNTQEYTEEYPRSLKVFEKSFDCDAIEWHLPRGQIPIVLESRVSYQPD